MFSKAFFDAVRTNILNGILSQSQVDALNAIDASWQKHGNTDPQAKAYVLSTIQNEVGNGMLPKAENLNYSAEQIHAVWPTRFPTTGAAQLYAHNPVKLGNFVYAGRYGNGDVASGDGFKYRGHGYQTTFKDAFKMFGGLLGVDLVTDPSVLDRDVGLAADVLIIGMVRGLYTGKKIGDYFTATKADAYDARDTVNPDKQRVGQSIALNWAKWWAALKVNAPISKRIAVVATPTAPPQATGG